jgi:serine/threonine-protein kinase
MDEGQILGDRYELINAVGRGGMATIYRATDLRMGRSVAVKILREVYSSDPKFVTRFQREARAASLLQHPNIVQVYDYGQTDENYYIVMEFIEGVDLRRYLKRHGKLSNERTVTIAHDVALALGAAHKRGIVHRDVKPQNVMVNDDGLVKLTDFGIASVYKDVEAERLTTTGMTLGTVQYYAPEQAQGEVVSPAADIYSLGIVMYEMLAGRTPFDGDTPVAVAMRHIQDEPDPPSRYNPNIAPGLENIILRCLAKDPRDRYRDGDALAVALEHYERRPSGRATAVTAGRAGMPVGLPADREDGYPPAGYGRPGATSGPGRGAPVMSGPRGGGMGTSGPRGVAGANSGPRGVAGANSGPGRAVYDVPSPTRPYGPAGGTVPRLGRITGPNGVPEDEEGGRRNGPVVGMVVVGVIVLLALSCFVVLSATGSLKQLLAFGAGAPPTATTASVVVPDFRGKTLAQAQALAQQYHLTVSVTATTQTPDTPPGQVVDQSPEPGSYPGITTVGLILSGGPGQVALPNLKGMDEVAACNILQQKPYYLVCSDQPPEANSLPAGEVTRTDPPAGALITAGTATTPGQAIKIWTSIGPPTPTPTVTPTATATCAATPIPNLTPTATPGPPTPTPCP